MSALLFAVAARRSCFVLPLKQMLCRGGAAGLKAVDGKIVAHGSAFERLELAHEQRFRGHGAERAQLGITTNGVNDAGLQGQFLCPGRCRISFGTARQRGRSSVRRPTR